MIKAKDLQSTSSYQCSLGRNNGEINFFTFQMPQATLTQPGMVHCHVSDIILSYHPYSSSEKDNITVSSCLSDSSISLLNQTINAKQALNTSPENLLMLTKQESDVFICFLLFRLNYCNYCFLFAQQYIQCTIVHY